MVISKISVDFNLTFTSFMHDYVHWHCSINYCVKLSLINETLCKKKMLSFHKEMISA